MVYHTIKDGDLESMMAGRGGQNEFPSLVVQMDQILQFPFMCFFFFLYFALKSAVFLKI